jgi:hypothetical protein
MHGSAEVQVAWIPKAQLEAQVVTRSTKVNDFKSLEMPVLSVASKVHSQHPSFGALLAGLGHPDKHF